MSKEYEFYNLKHDIGDNVYYCHRLDGDSITIHKARIIHFHLSTEDDCKFKDDNVYYIAYSAKNEKDDYLISLIEKTQFAYERELYSTKEEALYYAANYHDIVEDSDE